MRECAPCGRPTWTPAWCRRGGVASGGVTGGGAASVGVTGGGAASVGVPGGGAASVGVTGGGAASVGVTGGGAASVGVTCGRAARGAHRAVVRRGREAGAVGAPRARVHGVLVPCQLHHLAPGRRVIEHSALIDVGSTINRIGTRVTDHRWVGQNGPCTRVCMSDLPEGKLNHAPNTVQYFQYDMSSG
jgi:hypothetical protein